MRLKSYIFVLLSISGIVLAGCQSSKTDDESEANDSQPKSTTEKIQKVVVKGMVKAAIRNSPLSVIKSVTK